MTASDVIVLIVVVAVILGIVLSRRGSVSPPHHDFPVDGSLDDQVRELLRRGQKIQAIKLYRLRTGVDLKEAKEAVERLER